MEKKALGQRIRAIRRSKGYTQDALAASVKIGKGALSKIERGLTYPALDTLNRIAQSLNVPIHDLFLYLDDADEVSASRRARLAELSSNAEELNDVLLDIMVDHIKALKAIG